MKTNELTSREKVIDAVLIAGYTPETKPNWWHYQYKWQGLTQTTPDPYMVPRDAELLPDRVFIGPPALKQWVSTNLDAFAFTYLRDYIYRRGYRIVEGRNEQGQHLIVVKKLGEPPFYTEGAVSPYHGQYAKLVIAAISQLGKLEEKGT